MTTSPSIPVISVTWVIRRLPSRWRLIWMMRWIGALDLLAHRLGRQLEARHRHHVLEAGQRVARGVGVDGAHRAVVAGVHRLQHVDGFLAADLAEDDPVGAHAQRVLDEVAHGDLALALDVGGAGLQPHHVRLLQLQLGRVLDRHRALAVVDHPAHGVQQRGLARAGAAGDQDVEPRPAGDLQDRRHVGRDVALPRHDVEGDLLLGELADRDGRPVDGERRDDDVDAAAVLQARVDQRRRTRRPGGRPR